MRFKFFTSSRGLRSYLFTMGISALLLAASACGTKTPATASSMTLTPTTLDMTVGGISSLTANVLDSGGTALAPQPTIAYSSSDPSAVTVSPTGQVCAGVWDADFLACRTGTIPGAAVTVTGAVNGVTASISVTVHVHVDRITITAPQVPCVSQNGSLQFTATAFNKGVDVTSSIGSFSWVVSDGTVGQVNSSGLAVGRAPGITNVYASAATTTSTPLALVVCPVRSIQLAQVDTGNTSFTLNKGDTVSVEATVLDVLGNVVNGPTLNFSSSQSAVARATINGVVKADIGALTGGVFTVVASCSPTQCNNAPAGIIYTPSGPTDAKSLGFGYPIYSNLVRGTVAGATTTSVFVGGSQYPDGHGNHQLQVYDSETLNLQTTIALPYIANSIIFTRQGDKAFLGSSDGTDKDAIMTLDPISNAVTVFTGTVTGDSNITTVTGTVLAVSPDGAQVVVSNVSNGRVFVVNVAGNSAQVFYAPGIRSAGFSPDSFKVFLAGEGGVYEYAGTLHRVTGATAAKSSSVAYLSDGGGAYVSGNSLNAYATCGDQSIDSSNTPLGPVVSLFPGVGPSFVGVSATSWTAVTPAVTQGSCPPQMTSSVTSASFGSCNITSLTPLVDGSKVFATGLDPLTCSSTDVVPEYDVAAGTAGAIPIVSGGAPVAGDVSLDGAQLYVGVMNSGNGSMHFINLSTGVDSVQVDVPFVPALVGVQPK